MEEGKYTKVTPTSRSDPRYFKEDSLRELHEEYGEPEYGKVTPTSHSDFHHFMNEPGWEGIANFKNTVAENAKRVKTVVFGEAEPVEFRPFETKVVSYPYSDKYYYTAKIVRLNLDEERRRDFARGKGIRINRPQGVKKDLRDPNSIYSPDFGPTFDDASSYGSRHSCQCGATRTQQNEGLICPICGTKVIKKEDDFSIFGWIILDDDYVIHAGLYKSIEFFIGKKALNNILEIKDDKDENGFSIKGMRTEEEPFIDYGMIGFREHFDEIMDFYLKVNPNKKEYYDDIMKDRDKVFTHSIPVFTALLRPSHLVGEKFIFQDTNKNFNIMAAIQYLLNTKDSIKTRKSKKTRNQLLYDLQYNFMEVYDEVVKIMSTKKGIIRSLYGGRYNFTCRAVIVPNWTLRTDQIRLPFKALVKLLEHSIINILHNSYGMPMFEARTEWSEAFTNYNQRIWDIVQNIIKAHPDGIPFIINRNPTLQYGSILQMFCVGVSDDDPDNYTMEVPLLILRGLNADFDGDTLNIILLINDELKRAANTVFNPRNAMHISRNDGRMNPLYNLNKDVMVLSNALLSMTDDGYTQDERDAIEKCKAWHE